MNGIKETLFADPVYTSPEEQVVVKTNLYSVTSEERLWSGTTQTGAREKPPKLISSFVKLILTYLYQ